jgi:prepilin-type N-terminal cleavage/methylation domain-containing protein
MMTLRKLGTINRAQRGFTLIEIVIAIAITTLIGSAAATATYQVIRINASSTNRQIAITQVENAVHYISRDAQQSQDVIPNGPTVVNDPISKIISYNLITEDTLKLKWTSWDIDNHNHKNEVNYAVVDGVLQKTTKIDNDLPNTITVANNISAASGTWKTDAKVLTLQIQAMVGTGASQTGETRTFQINPRPAQ